MHYHGHRQRLREKLVKNPGDLRDYEVLELLLGNIITRKDTKPLAKELLQRFQSIKGVLDAKPAELQNIEGFGPALSSYWLLLREVLARYSESPFRQHEELCTPAQVAVMARLRLAGLDHEEIWIAFVDSKNRLLSWEQYHKGSVDSSVIYPRDILERSLLVRASGFFLVHNHPGGTSEPSKADLEVTKLLKSAAHTISLRFIDHIVVTDSECYSVMSEGFL